MKTAISKKPIAVDLDVTRRNIANLPNRGGFPIVYECANCGRLLSYWLGTKEEHCHSCGCSIDWRVITHINSTQSDTIEESDEERADYLKSAYVKLVNELNEEKQFETAVFISEFDDTE